MSLITKQISIFIENRPGRLAEVTGIIAEAGIDIRALSIADTADFGILRIIVDDPERLCEVLRGAGVTASVTSVIAVAVEDKPGGLTRVLKILSGAGVSIEYMYAFISKSDNEAYVLMRIEKQEQAIKLLEENGYRGQREE